MTRTGTRTLAALVAVAIAVCMSASNAHAANPAAWNFDLTTTGNDVDWQSPTTVDAGHSAYQISYEITDLIITVAVLGEIDAIAQGLVNAEDLVGDDVFNTLPVVLFNESVNESGTTADILVGVDEFGQAYASMTNVVLGTDPLFGLQIESIYTAGNVTATGIPEPSALALLLTGGAALALRRRRAA